MKIVRFTLFAAAAVLAACASTKPLPRLNQDARSSLGTVGVITVGPAVGGKVGGRFGDSAEAGALEGATGGSLAGLGAAVVFCGPFAWACAVPAVPIGLLYGVVSGREDVNAIPGSSAAEVQAAFNRAMADSDLQADLRHGVLRYTGSAGAYIDLGADAREPVSSPDYASVAGRGVGTVLEMSLTRLALANTKFRVGGGESNPSLTLVMTARARMIRVADRRVLWNAAEAKYESSAAQYSLWTARDSDLLRAEIANGSEMLARQIGEALFGAPRMARAEPTTPPLFPTDLTGIAVGGAD